MTPEYILVAQVLLLIVTAGLTFFRATHQNQADDSTAAKNYSEAAENFAKETLALQLKIGASAEKIEHLEKLLNSKNYSVTVVFGIGPEPVVHSVAIRPVEIEKKSAKLNTQSSGG